MSVRNLRYICDYDIGDDDDGDYGNDYDDGNLHRYVLVLQLIEPTVFHLMMMRMMIMMKPDNDGEDKNNDFQMMTVCEQS